MKGTIIEYNIQTSNGLISAEDGKRYQFKNRDWKSNISPALNQNIDFEIENDFAKSIYVVETEIKQYENTHKDNYGIVLSFIMIGAMFMPFYRHDKFIDGEIGIVLAILSSISLVLYYIGKKDILLKLVTLGIISIVIYVYFNIFSQLYDLNDFMKTTTNGKFNFNYFKQFSYGTYVIIITALLMLFKGLKK